MAVGLLANVGVRQASFARHIGGVRHRQGWKDSGNRENETHFAGREGWSKRLVEKVGRKGWSKWLVEKVGRKGWVSRIKHFQDYFSTIFIHRTLRRIHASCIGITILTAMLRRLSSLDTICLGHPRPPLCRCIACRGEDLVRLVTSRSMTRRIDFCYFGPFDYWDCSPGCTSYGYSLAYVAKHFIDSLIAGFLSESRRLCAGSISLFLLSCNSFPV